MTSEMFVLEGNPNIVVRKVLVGERDTYPYGYCYKCNHVVANHVKKSRLQVFESHTCKEKQHRVYGEKTGRVAHVPEVPKEEMYVWGDVAREIRKHNPAFKAMYISPVEEWRKANPNLDPEGPPKNPPVAYTDDDTRVQVLKTLGAMVPVIVQEVVQKSDIEAELFADEIFAKAFAPEEHDYDDDDEEEKVPPTLAQRILDDFHKRAKDTAKKARDIDMYKAKLSAKIDEAAKLSADLQAASEQIAQLQRQLNDPRFAAPETQPQALPDLIL